MDTQFEGEPNAEQDGPRVTREDIKDVARLRRSTTDRQVAGVASGIARHLDIDPTIVRVALIVSVFFGGAGLLIYGAAWLLVPEEQSLDHPLGLDDRSRVFALLGVAVLALLAAVGDWAGAFWFPWPVAVIALAVLWLVNKNNDSPYDSYRPASTAEVAATEGANPTTYAPIVPVGGYVAPAPMPNPRRRGPILFWFTMALIALSTGVLAVFDVAGANVAPSAYPALALAITTAMLLIGAFWGRAGGLIAVGLITAVLTVIVTAGSTWTNQAWAGPAQLHQPTSAQQVKDSYDLLAGEMVLDLSEVSDIENLDDRDLTVSGVAGRLEVIVPEGVDVSVNTQVVAGASWVGDQRAEGTDTVLDGFIDGGPKAPEMSMNVNLVLGEVVVRAADQSTN